MRRLLLTVFLVSGSIAPAASMAAEPLGRLFFTPAQRNVLDAGKFAGPPAAATPAPRTVHLNGVVTRSDAERTVWINGTPYHNGAPEGVRVKTDPKATASTSIGMKGKTATSRVKVGQQLDLNSGKVREDFSRRAEPAGDTAAPAADAAALAPAAKQSKPEDAAPASGIKDGAPPTAAR